MVVILGPTASGKSTLAVNIAKKFSALGGPALGWNGAEVISADSRQVYKGMDVGTGKITKKEMRGVPHHLLDVASPKRIFTVTQYRALALKAINKILKKGKLPILCGGTGFYIQAVVDGIIIPAVKPDWKLRTKLERLTTEQLFEKLKKIDPKRAKIIDRNNRRRLVRALEIILKTKKPIPALKKNPLPYPILIIGVKKEKGELKKLISERLEKRLKQGMVEEVKKLRESGLSWERLKGFGLEYRYIARYLKTTKDFRNPLRFERISEIPKSVNFEKSDFFNRLQKEIEHYAKRQMTWFKRDQRIHWIKKQPEAEKLVKKFL